MLPEKQQKLTQLALRVREHIVRLSTDGGCFTGASLSCADLLVYLYADCLNVRPDNLTDPTRDYLFLSKGHDVPALYGTFVELGFMSKERLDQHLTTDDHIYLRRATTRISSRISRPTTRPAPFWAISIAYEPSPQPKSTTSFPARRWKKSSPRSTASLDFPS